MNNEKLKRTMLIVGLTCWVAAGTLAIFGAAATSPVMTGAALGFLVIASITSIVVLKVNDD